VPKSHDRERTKGKTEATSAPVQILNQGTHEAQKKGDPQELDHPETEKAAIS